jgi:LCP family protein required for cell wall assembly
MQITEDGTYTIDDKEREFFKCNRAYKRDGIYGAMKELNRHMDLNIKECIAIDWEGVAHFIDTMGGIDAEIDDAMLPALNKAISQNPGEEYCLDSAGTHHLNGWQTVQYLRVRKYDGGSAPVREERNQDVVQQLFNKAQTMSIDEISDVYEQVANNIESNMSRTTLTETLASIHESTLESTPGWPYEYSTLWQDDDSYYYFVADTLASNVTELHKTLFGQENYEPSETVMTLNDMIETARKEQLH